MEGIGEVNTEGYVEEYPCDCQGDGHTICWIVRHPNLKPAVSFSTKEEAEAELAITRLTAR